MANIDVTRIGSAGALQSLKTLYSSNSQLESNNGLASARIKSIPSNDFDVGQNYFSNLKRDTNTVNISTAGSAMAAQSAAVDTASKSITEIMDDATARDQLSLSQLTILQQTATATLAQANTKPNFLLSLFR